MLTVDRQTPCPPNAATLPPIEPRAHPLHGHAPTEQQKNPTPDSSPHRLVHVLFVILAAVLVPLSLVVALVPT